MLLPGNNSSPEGTMHMEMEMEMEKNTSTSRKRRSLTIMLRDRSAKKARSTAEEDVEDQNETHEDQNEDQNEALEDQIEAHEDADILSSPTSSGADPMVRQYLLCTWLIYCVSVLNLMFTTDWVLDFICSSLFLRRPQVDGEKQLLTTQTRMTERQLWTRMSLQRGRKE